MKKTILIIATLAFLAGMNSLSGQTNAPADSAKTLVKPYPLKYCLVSGDKIGEMGKPASIIYKGQEIKFCCPGCVKDFKKDPDKFLKKLAVEEKKAKK
jgi:YHS domain-containing protein